jgi:hypothetical protein
LTQGLPRSDSPEEWPDVVLQLVVERRARALLDLRVEDAVDAAVVALLAVEIAVDRLGEQGVDHVVLPFLRDQDVDIELGAQACDPLHQLQGGHLQLLLRAGAAVLGEGVQRVVHQDRLQVAVGFDGGERFLDGGDAAEGDAERVVEGARGGVQPLHELAQDQVLVVDDEDAADGFGH